MVRRTAGAALVATLPQWPQLPLPDLFFVRSAIR